jgi:small subunit ribosomal protein S7
MTLCLRWLTQYARLRKEKTMEERLANEIIDASNGIGAAVKKRDDVHRMAESNKRLHIINGNGGSLWLVKYP